MSNNNKMQNWHNTCWVAWRRIAWMKLKFVELGPKQHK
jgi:hypothetical protein